MNPIRSTGRLARILAGLASGVVAWAIAASTATSAALAATSATPGRPRPADSPPLNLPPPAPGWDKHPPPLPAHLHTAITSGLTGAQITLLAVGTALLATALLALLAWARAARRRAAPTHA